MATPATRTPIKLARGSYSNLSASLDDLQEGEIIYAEDQNKLYVKEGSSLIDVTGSGGGGSDTNTTYGISCVDGDNTDEEKIRLTAGGSGSGTDDVVLEAGTGLSIARSGDKITFTNTVTDTNTQLTTEEVQDIIGAMVAGNTETNISVTYDDTNGKLDFVSTDTNTTYSVGDGGLTQNNFTNTLKTKLDGIADNAEVNVQSDWNSSSGDSQILNKPTIPSNLSDLSDVHNATPSDGQVLKWVNSNSRWEPGADSTGGGGGGATNLSNTADGTSLTIESSSGDNTSLPAATTSAWGVMTDEDKTNLDANTAKVTNATHTGDVTGSGALTIADDAVTYAKMQNVSATDRVLGRDSSGAGVVEEITPANLRTMINVEDGATADQSNAEIRAAVEAASDSNVFTDDDHSKLNGIAPSANNYTHPSVNHIPAGGSSGQVLKYSSSGTAAWGTDNDTTYSTVSTSAAGLAPQLPGSHGGKFLKADGTWEVPPDTDTNTQLTTEQVQDIVGGMFTGNTETNITATYQDSDGTIDLVSTDTNTQLSTEEVQDIIGAMVDGGTETNISVTYDDTNGKLNFVSTDTNTTDLVSDTSPQLGGSLDVNSQDIVSTSNGDIDLDPNGSGKVVFKGNSTKGSGQFVLNCEDNSHGIVIKGPPHSAAASYTFTFPNDDGSANQVLKTDGSGTTSWVNQTTSYTHPNHSGDVTSSGDGATTIANDAVTTAKIDDDAVTADKLADSINTEIAANTAKVTNATHTGDVTGATTLTIADDKIEEKHINAGGTPGADKVLVYDSSATGNWKWAAQSGSGGGGDVTAVTAGTALTGGGDSGDLTINADVGIANNKLLQVDDDDAADNDYAKFTANGIEGRSYTEVKTDLSLNSVENTAVSTWAGTSNITTLGTIGTGTWQGTAIGDTYISSASTWNAKQAALTFGIANTNAVKIDHASVADDDYAKFTSSGIEGRSATEVKLDLSLNNVENTAVSTWAGSANITTLGTVNTVTSTAHGTAGVRKIYTSTDAPSGGANGDVWIKYTA